MERGSEEPTSRWRLPTHHTRRPAPGREHAVESPGVQWAASDFRRISIGGGSEPLWSRDGRPLYYRVNNDVVAVRVATGATLVVGERKVGATGSYNSTTVHQNRDVSPNGAEFLMLRRAGEGVRLILVQKWGREVAALTAAKNAK